MCCVFALDLSVRVTRACCHMYMSVAPFSPLPSSVSPYGYASSCPFSHPLMDIWLIYSLELLQIEFFKNIHMQVLIQTYGFPSIEEILKILRN